jgi:hypothetical protein
MQDQVITLIGERSWSVFIGIFPDHNAATAASTAISRETGGELQASELVYCGVGAAVIAIRRCDPMVQVKARHLAGSVSGMLRQLAVQLAYREMGPQQASAAPPADTDAAQLRRISQELNDQLTILVNGAESLLLLVERDARARQFAIDLLVAAAHVAEMAKKLIALPSAANP